MEYRSRGLIASVVWVTQNALLWVGVIGIAWSLLKPGGGLFRFVAFIVERQPTSLYSLAVGVPLVLAAKCWLDGRFPNAIANFLTFGCAFAGSYFILRLLLPM